MSDIVDQLQQHNIIASTAGWTAQPASGGLNNQVFVAISPTGEPRFTIRCSKRAHRLNQERSVLQRLEKCAGVPQHPVVLDNSMLVHTYLPGQPQPLAKISAPGVANLARLLACIHRHLDEGYTIWPSADRRAGAMADAYRARLRTLADYQAYQEPPDRSLHKRIVAIQDQLQAFDLTGPAWKVRSFHQLHGDLSFGNLIWHGDSIGLVDWEYARSGDAAEDIAYLFTEQPLDDCKVTALKTAYLDCGGEVSVWGRVSRYLPLTALDAALWWMDHLASIGEDPVNHHEVQWRLEQAENPRNLP